METKEKSKIITNEGNKCPYCGNEEMIEAIQGGTYASITVLDNKLGGTPLYHLICRRCGVVVKSYVKDPEMLLRRKDRQ